MNETKNERVNESVNESVNVESAEERVAVTDRIRTFDDALRALGERAGAGDEAAGDLVADYESNAGNIASAHIVAYMKLCIIAAALNEGWMPDLSRLEERWYPVFCLYSKDELAEMAEERKKQLWLFGGSSFSGANCGLASAFSYNAWSGSSSYVSARLAVRDRDLAIYFGRTFTEEWGTYLTQ